MQSEGCHGVEVAMKAVILEMPQKWLEERRSSDASQWDEMWNGVLHMAPVPNRVHQRFAHDLHNLLQLRWGDPIGGQVDQEVNVVAPADEERWTENYRIPDLVLVPSGRAHIDKIEYMVGAPLVCIEIRSPKDESYQKLPFYFDLGVPEVWIIHRDTKKPEVFLRGDSEYRLQSSDDDGWTHSPTTDVQMKGSDGKLHVRFRAEGQTYVVPK
jgi:Uma2 family endonuclease